MLRHSRNPRAGWRSAAPAGGRPTAGLHRAGPWLVLALACLARLAVAAPDAAPAVTASLAADARSFSLDAPGLGGFHATWAATIQREGNPERVLASSSGEVASPGPVTTIRFPEDNIDLLFEFRTDGPAVFARAGIRNTGTAPLKFLTATPIAAECILPEKTDGWFLTGFHPLTPVLLSFQTLHEPARIHEHGGFYHSNGSGFLFGPAGEPTAYLTSHFARLGENTMAFQCVAEMSGARVEPGETRWSQQAVLLLEPPRAALPRWADWVSKSHHARAASPPLTGWGSWYSFRETVTGKDILAQVDTVHKNPECLRPDVILIDRGHEVQQSFPEGLAFYAKAIAATGARPGLRLELNGRKDPCQWIRKAVSDGFSYLKLGDMQPPPELLDPKLTKFERMRTLYAAARAAAGPGTYLLNSPLYLDRASVGIVDASRTGSTVPRNDVVPAMREVLRSYYLNGRWFAIDNDHFYLGTDIANVSDIDGGWPVVRTWMSMAGLSCGAAFTSDPLDLDSVKPFWRNLEVMTPPTREQTEVPDLGTDWHWPRLVGHVRRDWGNATVALLWNPEDKETTVGLKFSDAGMDSGQRYAVWSFWDNRYLGLTQEFWNSPRLAPTASQHLRFTPIPAAAVPVLIGSNLHIYCGAAEIKNIRASRSAMTIELTDAGARAGDLFVYSRYQPVMRSMAGMQLSAIDQAGENVWRIRLRDRLRGQPQRIDLAIQLPVTLQWWFWAMLGAMLLSLLAAAWRYVAWLHLQRRHSLAEERSRIARDLHDGMGADLTRISLLVEVAARQPGVPPATRHALENIVAGTHTLATELDSVVWATDPRHDTLEHLVQYLAHFAQAFLEPAGIRLRLDLPDQMPPIAISSAIRHNLFLAAKEALNNIVRHAAATTVFLRVRHEAKSLVLEIEDNGRGLAGRDPAAPGADGLLNIANRMEKLNGHCEYLPGADGRGTLVRLRLPLKDPDNPPKS